VRPPAVAGSFYPSDPAELRRTVQGHIAYGRGAPNPFAPTGASFGGRHGGTGGPAAPKVLIAPHAGYEFSGPTAGHAYARLESQRDVITRVVLLGPTHRVAVRGMALPDATAFATPLGEIPLDRAAIATLRPLRSVLVSAAAHAQEHSLEVHLPFLQEVLAQFALVPLAVGDATPAEVADVLALLWGGPETLIVISTDLSHYLSYREAVTQDGTTLEAVLNFDASVTHEAACGATPINGLLALAAQRNMSIELIDQSNSGDTAGPRDHVVGYAALALYEKPEAPGIDGSMPPALLAAAGPQMLLLARAAIERALGHEVTYDLEAAWLWRNAAVFVTLTQNGALRGCMGSLEATRSLKVDLAENAAAAALRDPRFAPVTLEEFAGIDVEISLLEPAEAVRFSSEADLLKKLVPKRDGLILEWRGQRATFLPQVWAELPDPKQFLTQLKQKAGWAADFWSEDIAVSRYRVQKFAEKAPQH
jgi:AmmeMemoRadiSam system protein B/AmmeMemoRadiSam system protein A